MTIRASLYAVLLIAAVQGLVRVAVIPLWAHYDEPGHYEYISFLIRHHRLPLIEDRDRSILNRIAASDRSIVVCPESPAVTAACLGPSGAFDEPPLYYVLVAGVLKVVNPVTLDHEVRWARLVSVLLGVAVTLSGFLTVRAAAPGEPALAVAVAALLATIPGLVDVMSGVNNGVGATAAFSFFVWVMALAFRDGARLSQLTLVAWAVCSCMLMKATAFIALPLAVGGLWLVASPHLSRWFRWGVPTAAVVAAGLLSGGLLWPAEWQAYTARPPAGRRAASSPIGAHVFHVWQEGNAVPTFWQPLQRALSPGQAVTLGAWVRTIDGSRRLPLPVLGDGNAVPSGPYADATPAWAFHRYTTTVPAGAESLVVYLPPIETGEALYDGLVVTDGYWPEAPPTFDDDTAGEGVWGQRRFVNFVRNGSAEAGWPALRYAVDRLIPAGGVNQRLASWLDWHRTRRAFWSALKWQFITFWAGYGTGVADGPFWTRLVFALLTAVSMSGLAVSLIMPSPRRAAHEARFMFFAAATLVAVIGMSALRIDPVGPSGRIDYIPAARYAYVGIVPAAVLVTRGWAAWWSERSRNAGLAVLIGIVFAVGVYLFVAVQRPWYGDFACRQTACTPSSSGE